MKEKILNSNKFKRYEFYVKLLSVMLLVLGAIIEMVAFIIDNHNAIEDISPISGVGFLILIIIFSPPIAFYGIKLILMRKNIKNYQLVTGTIMEIKTAVCLRNDSCLVNVYISSLNKTLITKVYNGTLYDKVALNVNVEIAYDSKTGEIVIIGIY